MSESRLLDVIRGMIRRSSRYKRELDRGLILGWNPDSDQKRFTLSRVGVDPSDVELRIVEICVRKALKLERRPFDGMSSIRGLVKGKYKYHLIYWVEPIQERIL